MCEDKLFVTVTAPSGAACAHKLSSALLEYFFAFLLSVSVRLAWSFIQVVNTDGRGPILKKIILIGTSEI